MEVGGALFFRNRDEWRKWLEENHKKEKEVWLIYYKAYTGKVGITYDESVEEAICFAWIDGIVKRLDEEKFGRKFMPRRKNSRWSESNKKRAEGMIREGSMAEAGMALIREAKRNGEWFKAPPEKGELEVPPLFDEALVKNRKASDYFYNLAPTYRRHFVSWVSNARKEETQTKRIAEALSYLEQNKKLPLK